MTWIIAVCGTMGSGKSTLVDHATAALPDCEMVLEDHYNCTTDRTLDDINVWWQRGGSVSEFDLSGLVSRLRELCPEKILQPEESTTIRRRAAQKMILVETHFGRLHPVLRPWIDYQYWVEVPADIAIARKVAQLSLQIRHSPGNGETDGLRWIEEFCRGYLSTTRKLFEMQRQQVRSLSDVSIDGQGTSLEVCQRFLESLPQKYRPE